MARYAQGIYTPKNPEKYIGKSQPKFRSGWEMVMFRFCDNNPSVLKWASEAIRIPYKNPLTGKQTVYVPDLFMTYKNRAGQTIAEIIEIKPQSQTSLTEAKSQRDRAAAIVNQAKWAACQAYCKRVGVRFRIVTEADLFANGKSK